VNTVSLCRADRQSCLDLFRTSPNHATRQRALILLLLSAGVSYAVLTEALGCSSVPSHAGPAVIASTGWPP
jgi:hypothetical protein